MCYPFQWPLLCDHLSPLYTSERRAGARVRRLTSGLGRLNPRLLPKVQPSPSPLLGLRATRDGDTSGSGHGPRLPRGQVPYAAICSSPQGHCCGIRCFYSGCKSFPRTAPSRSTPASSKALMVLQQNCCNSIRSRLIDPHCGPLRERINGRPGIGTQSRVRGAPRLWADPLRPLSKALLEPDRSSVPRSPSVPISRWGTFGQPRGTGSVLGSDFVVLEGRRSLPTRGTDLCAKG